jgi:hypothetical protein
MSDLEFNPKHLETVLAQMKIGEKFDALQEFKLWAASDPDTVRELVAQQPVLAQALLKMMIEFKMLQVPPESDASLEFAPEGASNY